MPDENRGQLCILWARNALGNAMGVLLWAQLVIVGHLDGALTWAYEEGLLGHLCAP